LAFREVRVLEIKEVFRRWQRKDSFRTISAAVGVDRKTVRRYVRLAQKHGLQQDPADPVPDDVLAAVIAEAGPATTARELGAARALCRLHRTLIEGWIREGCRSPKIVRLLHQHTGVEVPGRTLRRFIHEELLEAHKAAATIRLPDPPPGQILQIDFMLLGKANWNDKEVSVWALICVAAYSRHTFIWPCLRCTTADVIAGLEAAWAFFGGIFPTVVADNPKTIAIEPDSTNPVFNADIAAYSQARGFLFDLARVRHPQDKPRVERTVSYSRNDAWSGERYLSLDLARDGLARWCKEVAGRRRHGTTRRHPIEDFITKELPLLLPPPTEPYDSPRRLERTVGRDNAVTVAEALYSVPFGLSGQKISIEYDSSTVKLYHKRKLVKVHPRVGVGENSIDPLDMPDHLVELVARDTGAICQRAASHGVSVGEFARRLLDVQLPWTRIRQVYCLLDLCRRYGNAAVDAACQTSLELAVVELPRLKRMLELRCPPPEDPPPPTGKILRPRFGRDPQEFKAGGAHGS